MLTGLVVDFDKLGFNADLYVKTGRQQKFRKVGVYSGTMSTRAAGFFTKPMKRWARDENGELLLDERGNKIWSGESVTGFQKYCQQHGIEFEPKDFDDVLMGI